MLKIKKNIIEAEGTLHTQIVDYLMLSEHLYKQIAKEFGERTAKRFFKRKLFKLLKRGLKNAGNNIE